MKTNDKFRALIDAFIDLAENNGCTERGTMESLLDIFDPEELAELGYGDRVRAYLAEYGAEDEDLYTEEELRRRISGDLNRVMAERFPSCHDEFPDFFLDEVVNEVYETSDWQDNGVYVDADISLAIQRTVLKHLTNYDL